jgi:hypothetical protein
VKNHLKSGVVVWGDCPHVENSFDLGFSITPQKNGIYLFSGQQEKMEELFL